MIKCDPRAKAKCQFKEPCCGDETGYFLEGSDCDKFNQKVCFPPFTNADRIRAMSDAELAKFIPDWSYTGACKCDEQTLVDCNNECEKCVLEWLQQPAEEAPDDANE